VRRKAMNDEKVTRAPLAKVPACSVFEENETVIATIEMPGVTKEGLEIRIDGNELHIAGTVREERPGGKYLLRERRVGSYAKYFTIDETVDRDKIEAALVDGVLTLRLHIKEASKPRTIKVG
jgi:HSP20 family protein